MLSTYKQLVGWARSSAKYFGDMIVRGYLSRKYKKRHADILYFLHIPKTSGTSITAHIDAHFENDEILKSQLWSHLLSSYTQEEISDNFATPLSKYKLIRGHFGYGIFREIGAMPKYITMLRHPAERSVSQFFHLKVDPVYNSWFRSDFLKPDESIDEFFNDKMRSQMLCNVMTKYLSHTQDFKTISIQSGYDIRGFNLDSHNSQLIEKSQEHSMAQLAKKRLKDFHFVGIQEYFEESVILLNYKMGWHQTVPSARLMDFKKNPGFESLSEKTKNRIMRMNTADLDLYQFAKKNFEIEFVDMCTDVLGDKISRGYFIDNRAKLVERLTKVINIPKYKKSKTKNTAQK